jgi:cytochrome c biogenesis protein CcdA
VSSSAQTVPLSVALVAGALVALNPCSVPLLPAFLSYYLGVEREGLPRARAPGSCRACSSGRC